MVVSLLKTRSDGPPNPLEQDIFSWFENGDVSIAKLKIFCEQYYLTSKAFPAFLAAAIVSIESEAARFSLVANLWDEFGRGNTSRFHREMLRNFVRACGVVDPDSVPPLPTTRAYLDGMAALCASSDTGIVLGALGPGCEDITPAEYKIIYTGLLRSKQFSGDELEFFKDHIQHDVYHSDGIASAIKQWISDHGEESIQIGRGQSFLLESLFWRGIWEEMITLGMIEQSAAATPLQKPSAKSRI